MKKILVIADGLLANVFLQRLEDLDATDNIYHIVYYKESTLTKKRSDKFIYYHIDPTSFTKLSMLLEDVEFYQVMLILGNKTDLQATYENIRKIDSNQSVVILDKWNLGIVHQHTTVIDMHERVANILSNYLPDIPLFAQNIGLGQGEIMEFKIPFGSAYVYRHVGNIEQKRWKIAAIFRKQEILLPTSKTMLVPDDTILAVGNPNVLKGVYKSINRQFGQFPLPFGQNIYVLIDMVMMNAKVIDLLCNDAMIMHAKLNSKKLVFRVVNAKYGKVLDKLKKYQRSTSIEVIFDFLDNEVKDVILQDIDQFYIGLLVTNNTFFKEYKKFLFNLRLPVLKIGKSGFFNIKYSVLLSYDSEQVEQLSSVIFDLSSQLEIDISLFDFQSDKSEECEKIIEHFESLSKLFEKKVNIVSTDKNPIRELLPKDDFLQFVIFDKDILTSPLLAFFSTNVQKHYFRFMDKYQLFLPYES